jgi:serine protease AprX
MISGETIEAADAAARATGMTLQQTWRSSGIVVAIGSPAQVRAAVLQPGVRAVEGDQPISFQLETAHKATRSDVAQAYKALDGVSPIGGAGVSVAIIDSGIDGTHPFFQRDGKSTVVANLKNVCTVLSGPTETCFQQTPLNDTDTTAAGGHGTHVAGITGGVPTTLASGEKLRGSAPDATLIGLSVGAANSVINANAAMQWVLEHHRRPCAPASAQDGPIDPACPPIKATNHSYGPVSVPAGGHKFVESNPTVTIQRNLVKAGVTVVWAAGNSDGDGSIATTNPPAMDPTPGVLMVASYNDEGTGTRDGELSTFSSRGHTGTSGSWPDLSAPGDLITSACRHYLPICATGLDPKNGPGATDLGTFNTISGTSMATPYVAGVVAQLAQVKPGITPAEVEDRLEDSAYAFGTGYAPDTLNPDTGTSFDKGHGLVDVAATLSALLGQTAPGPAAPVCTGTSLQVVDRADDAHQVILLDTPLPSEPGLDIRSASLLWDGAKQDLTFNIRVTDLAEAFSGTGEYFRFYVTRNGDPEVYAAARRGAAGESFSLRQFDSGLSTPLTGTFSAANDLVTMVLPAADYAKVIPGAALSVGDTITVGQVLAQRDTSAATITTDTATGSCPFVVGTSTPIGGTGTAPTPTSEPTTQPTTQPTTGPTTAPTSEPTTQPTTQPTSEPTPSPSCQSRSGNGKGCKRS